MSFRLTPLFFLSPCTLRWTHDQAYFEHLMDTPFVALFAVIDRFGIWFPYKGDEVCWTWPWRRRNREGDNRGMAPFISVGFSGTGEWGDARFWTLKELDAQWKQYEEACEWDATLGDGLETFVAEEEVNAGGLVVLTEGGGIRKASRAERAECDEIRRLGEAFDNIGQRT